MKRFVLPVVLFASLSLPGFAQETRSTLTGHVADSSGAAIPHAQITITNIDTGVKTTAQSNGVGDYTVPFLPNGRYEVAATAAGFKAYDHKGLTLQTEQTVTENIKFEIGDATEVVTVQAETPLVDTATASTGQTLTAEEVEDLPSNGRSPLGFARFEYGAVAKGKHAASQTRPFDNSTADDFSLGGGASASNELTLNGVPNMQDSSRTAGFSPLLDAVDAVHVDEFAANAALGDTSGGAVNITTKSGTNQFHGTISEYYSGSRPLTAKPYFTPAGTAAPSTHFNQFGGNIGGPVRIPKLFDGRDKIFFMYAFEGYIGNAPATTITSVPTDAERGGDFSTLLTNTSNGQIYNPYSGTLGKDSKGNTIVNRTPIANNCLFSGGACTTTATDASGNLLQLSPVAKAYLALVPHANYAGASTKPDGENNYFASDPTTNNYKSHELRVDVDLLKNNRLSLEAHRSKYANGQANIFFDPLTGTTSKVTLWGGFVEDVHTFNSTTNLDFRLGFSRSENSSQPNSNGTNPTAFGFPSYIASNSSQPAIPYMTFTDSDNVPSLSAQPGNLAYFDTIQLFSSFNKTIGHHTIKIGPDIRQNKNSTAAGSGANGAYTFNTKSVTGYDLTSSSSTSGPGFGGSIALFELGLPTSGSFTVNQRFQYNDWYTGGFIQDDWKVLPNLTISMGLRMEAETSIVESGNRAVTGFNPTAVNAATVKAESNYAASPSALLPAASFTPTGGLIYASPSQRYAYETPSAYWSPRIGFAYSPLSSHGSMSIRGGFGIYMNPFNDYNAPQSYGFAATSTYFANSSNQTNMVPTSSLSDPFPTINPIVQPYGSELGVNTNLGGAAIYFAPLHVPYTEKGSLDIQKQFGRSWLVEAGYFTTHAVHLSSSLNVSAIPLLPFLSHQQQLDTSLTSALNNTITNPFKGLFPAAVTPNGISVPNTTSYNTGPTISVAQALQQYPEYSGVTEQLVPNQNGNFNAIMLKLQKRMSYGLQFDVNYEFSRQLGAQSTLNQGQTPAYGETSSDFPQHLTATVIYQLPFGQGRRWLNQSRWLSEAVGGWQTSVIYQALSGTPISWGNVIYNGDFHDFNNHPHAAGTTPSFNVSGFDSVLNDPNAAKVQPNSYNYRTFPGYLLRSDANNNFDISVLKDFTFGDHFVLQPRVDAFNVLNHVQFQSANVSPTSSSFGEVNSQLNTNRQLQGGIHLLF